MANQNKQTSTFPGGTKKGFTLIELLVVITILAVLAVISFAAYRGFTGRGNDARRQADITAVANALEANKAANGGTYQPLAVSQFSSGAFPTDPTGLAAGTAAHGSYCISFSNTGVVGNLPTLAQLYTGATNTCNATAVAGVGANGVGWSALGAAVPTNTTTVWMVCGATGDPAAAVDCNSSAQ